jgi:hypothetical protein
MSTMVKEKKPFLPQRKSSAPLGGAGTSVTLASVGGGSANHVVIGGEPRVHLLPSDVSDRKKSKGLKRKVAIGLIVVVALVAIGYGAATVSLAASQSQLQTAQTATSQLVSQQAKYNQVTKIKTDISSIQAAQKTGTTQEILWKNFTVALEGTLPAGATITALQANIDAPFAASNTAAVPLVGTHMATVQATVSMDESTIAPWLTTLSKLKGYVASTPDSVKSSAGSQYTVVVTIYLDSKALANRFVKTAGSTK